MNKKLLISLLKSNVNEIKGIIDDLEENKTIPSVFYDLTLSKIKNLYVQFKLVIEEESNYNKLSYSKMASDITAILDDSSVKVEDNIVTNNEEEIGKKEEDYDRISKLREQDFLSIQINFNPIKSISEAIALNDKIWFTKSLFDGNLNLFNETVEKINNLEYLEKAIDYLDNNFAWNYENSTVRKFFQYVYMRYA